MASSQAVLGSLAASFVEGKCSDLTITCGEDTYNVHKIVVCTRSDFFARALRFGGKESQDNKINLPEDEPSTIRLLVQYLYGGEYEPTMLVHTNSTVTKDVNGNTLSVIRTDIQNPRLNSIYTYAFPHQCTQGPDLAGAVGPDRCASKFVCPHHFCGYACKHDCIEFICEICTQPLVAAGPEQLLTHANMYAIGDKYDVVGLKELSATKLRLACKVLWRNPAFAVAVHYILSNTTEHDTTLEQIVVNTIASHSSLIETPWVQYLMTEFDTLARQILMERVRLGQAVD